MPAAPPPLLLSTAALVVANLVPLGGALLGIWSVYDLLLLFWAENLVIGAYQVLRMGTVLVRRQLVMLAIMIPFFIVHYGIFAFVHGVFLTSLLAPDGQDGMEAAAELLLSRDGLLWPLAALVASHGVSFAVNFLGAGEWRDVPEQDLMFQPYTRVVLLHVVILLGGVVVMTLGEPVAALVLLVGLKIGVDIVAHRREHRGAAVPAPRT